jgi:(p)ppGpp synthase/HD superfamily hydrolase
MAVPSDQPPDDVRASAAQPRTDTERACLADLVTTDQASALIRSTLAFAAVSHGGQRRASDGAAFIEHPIEVAELLRDAGCLDVVVAAGLLHDLVEDTHVTVAELTMHFGPEIANLVQAVSQDASILTYRQRKQTLREQVRSAGRDAALIFAADKIAKVRELPDRVRRDRARFDMAGSGQRTRDRLERYHQQRLAHYHETLRMLQDVAPRHSLVDRLAGDLGNYLTTRAAVTGDRT